MTLLDAREYDPGKDRKKRTRITLAIAVVLVVLGVGWWFRYWPEERIVGRFFDDLQKQDYKTAYGIWMHDPAWQEHPDRYSKYPFGDFYRDWGPGGDRGIIKTQRCLAQAHAQAAAPGWLWM